MFRSSAILSVVVTAVVGAGYLGAQQEGGDKEIAFQGTVTVPFQNAGENTQGLLVPRVGYFLSRRNFVGLENDDFFATGFQAYGVSLLYRLYLGGRGSRFQPFLGVAPGFLSKRQVTDVQLVVSTSSYNAALQQINALPAAQRPSATALLTAAVQTFQDNQCLLQVSNSSVTGCTPVQVGTRKVTTSDFQGAGELGVKFYLSRKFAFETSYRLLYLKASSPSAQDIYDVKATVSGTTITNTFSKVSENNGKVHGPGGFKENANNFFLFGFSYVF